MCRLSPTFASIKSTSYNIGGTQNAGDCPVTALHSQGGYRVNNKLSTSIAEFAAFNQALHDAATDAGNAQYFLQLNIKHVSNDGGAEQLWICSACNIDGSTDIPEPASLPLALLGLAIAGASMLRLRRR